MKKNKTMAYALAAALLVGGTFVGTKALFHDEIDVTSELQISTGDLDIEVVNQNSEWILTRNGDENNTGTGTGTATFDNLKPGDVLTKTMTVKNEGTLNAKVTLANNFGTGDDKVSLGVLDGLVKPSQTVNDTELKDEPYSLEPGQTMTIQLVLTVDENGGGKHVKKPSNEANPTSNEKNYNTDLIEEETVNLAGAWTLTAEQTTAPTQTTK